MFNFVENLLASFPLITLPKIALFNLLQILKKMLRFRVNGFYIKSNRLEKFFSRFIINDFLIFLAYFYLIIRKFLLFFNLIILLWTFLIQKMLKLHFKHLYIFSIYSKNTFLVDNSFVLVLLKYCNMRFNGMNILIYLLITERRVDY